MRTISAFSFMMLVLIAAGCDRAIDPPTQPSSSTQPETPTGLTASIADGTVLLAWSIATPANVSKYLIYNSDSTDAVDAMKILDSTEALTFTVHGLSNGRRYYFRVSAVDSRSRLEGDMSTSAVAIPGVFAININAGAFYTRSLSVSVDLTAPQGTQLAELSEDSLFAGAHWATYTGSAGYELSNGDGVKRLYARFQLSTGGSSVGQVSDTIILDRIATIDSVTANPTDSMLQPGDHIHLALFTHELGGTASVNITSLGTISLNDKGESGDTQAGNGIYEVNYIVPAGTELSNAEVVGNFTDAAGNAAPARSGFKKLNLGFAPASVVLSGTAVSSSELLLDWTRSGVTDFSRYELYRSTNSGMTAAELVTTITAQGTVSYRDTALDADKQYYYRISVLDNQNHATASNIAPLKTLVNDAPEKITLAANRTSADTLGVDLSWTQANDADFDYYQIVRGTTATLGNALTIRIISGRTTNSYQDHVAAKGDYYYWIYVFDKQGASTVSDAVHIQVQ